MNMNYEEFKERLQSELKDYLDKNYKDTEVVIKENMKVNKKVDSIIIMGIPGHENTSPSIPAQDVFERYLDSGDFETEMKIPTL